MEVDLSIAVSVSVCNHGASLALGDFFMKPRHAVCQLLCVDQPVTVGVEHCKRQNEYE